MPYTATLAEKIQRLLLAQDWTCKAKRFTVDAIEPALSPVHHVWLAGDHHHLTNGEVMQVRPNRIIVPDHCPQAEIDRLAAAMKGIGRRPDLVRFTRFIDFLWDAPLAAERAGLDANAIDDLPDFALSGLNAKKRHIPQHLRLDGAPVADHRLLERALAADGQSLAILADAGLGKSELLKWYEWRYSVSYQSADSQNAAALPPVALRIPLRGLRSLSMDALAHHLSNPAENSGLPTLTRIRSGRCLRELLRLRRIVLLLDGADELMISSDGLREGLLEVRRAVSEGGQVVLATRVGHLLSSRNVRDQYKDSEIAVIEPLSAGSAQKLLEKYGASEIIAEHVVRELTPSGAQGIPLFLLLALVGVSGLSGKKVQGSRTEVLLTLLHLFCQRDEERLGVPVDEQMKLLTDFAHWANMLGGRELDKVKALEDLGLGQGTGSREAMIKNPHALLTQKSNDVIGFKYTQFFSLFLAKAISEDWHSYGFESTREDLRRTQLDEATVEFLSRLLTPADIAGGWAATSADVPGSPGRQPHPLVRRNVLALALAHLEDTCPGGTPSARSALLAELLGGKVISDVLLAELVIQRINLAGWTLRHLQSRNGALLYCENLDQCDFDDTIYTLDMEGTELASKVDEATLVDHGSRRLRKIIRPLLRKNSDGLINMLSADECKDPKAWDELHRKGLAEKQRIYGDKHWVLTANGLRLLGSFASADRNAMLPSLIGADPALRSVVKSLGALKE